MLREVLTSQDTSTAITVGDATAGVNAVLSRTQAVVTNTVLTISELTQFTLGASRDVDVEAAARASANEGIGTSREGSDGNKVLHYRLVCFV